jgi:radical SAM superfamily enzyme YgiQ (UPF0313 family)
MVVLGGPHPSGEPVLSLQESPYVDVVAKGEGEFTMLDIANGLPLEKVNGVFYRRNGGIVNNPGRDPIQDIDELPLPARHLLDMRSYSRPSRFTSRNLSLRTTSIFTARGCPYRCNFCAGPLVFCGKVRFHSPERVMREIEELISKHSIEALYFAEDMFLSSRKRAEELLGMFKEKGVDKRIKWIAQAKASIITPELLALMKDAGCVGIEYGFESGSQRVLGLMNKHLKIDESLRAAALTRQARLRFQANIIVGYPGEREDDFKDTIDFVKKVRPNMVGFNLFMPLPGTPSYEQLKREGRALPKWDDVGDPEAPQTNYADMSKEAFERLYIEARLKVILPINLRSFLADNARNPFRLIKVACTQFGGVLIKTSRSIARLRSLAAAKGPAKTRILFVSYNGLLEPILPSQAVPYLKELSGMGYEFILFTYEKKRDLAQAGREGVEKIRKDLAVHGIGWRYRVYHKDPPVLSTLFDLAAGIFSISRIIRKERVRIIHVRGITPGMMVMALAKIFRVKILFDMRGLLAEEYVGGGLWTENSVQFRLVKDAERKMLKRADAITVLTRKHLELNKRIDFVKSRGVPMDVVPCCVDMIKFDYRSDGVGAFKKALGLDGKFVLMYPGKLGTFYLVDEMLDFYKVMAEKLPGSIFVILTNDDPSVLMQKAKAAGVEEDRLMVIRAVPFEEMPKYLAAADAGVFFINPYKKIGSSPIKMGEFLASGVPVVINPGVGDTEELVRENNVGVVVTGFSDGQYGDAIDRLRELKKEGEALRERCRKTAGENLSLQGAVISYARIYRALDTNGPAQA